MIERLLNAVMRKVRGGWLAFALKALLPEDADQRQELGDLFQVEDCGVVQLDDGHGLFVVGTTTAILLQTGSTHTK